MAEHNVTLELFYDGGWHTAPVLDGTAKYRRGNTSIGNDTDPAEGELTINNASEAYAPRSVASSLYGKIGQNTPCRLSADSSVRMYGEVALWKPQRPIKGPAYTDIQMAGILQRIGRGTDPIQSALRRYYLKNAVQPVVYWPLEGGSGADTLYDEISNAPTALSSLSGSAGDAGAQQFGKAFLSDGSEDVANVAGSWLLDLEIPASVVTATGQVTMQWHANFGTTVRTGASDVALKTSMLFDRSQPRYMLWQVFVYDTGTVEIKELEASSGLIVAGPTTVYSGAAIANPFDGTPRAFQLDLAASGGTNVAWALYINGQTISSGTYTPGFAGGMNAKPFLSQVSSEAPNDNPTAYGHHAVFTQNIPIANGSYAALIGYVGETAADRFDRLCDEEGVTGTVVGTSAESMPMGPQSTSPFLDQLDEIVRTDDASIFESRSALGLTMRTGGSKLNQSPTLTVSYLGQIEPTLVPVFGDEGIRNDVTARNPDGITRQVIQTTGPRNVQAPGTNAQSVGRYKTSVNVNTSTANALADEAGWRVNLGTYDGTWYAEVTADLDMAPSLTTAVNAVDIGDVVAISNLPVDEALDTVDGVVIGIEESLPSKGRLVTFYLVPAAPYRVGKLANTSGDTDPVVGHLDTDGSTTTGSIAPGATSFSVATPSGPLWTTVADDFPFDVIVGGQRVSISSITGASSPQTFNVKSAVTGGLQVRYAIASGAAVNVQQPVILAM